MLPLDRRTLDVVQFTSRRFLRLITERMSDVCLREIRDATFNASDAYYYNRASFFIYVVDARGTREARNFRANIAHLFSQFVQLLRGSYVRFLELKRVVFTPKLAELVLQSPIAAGSLRIIEGSCAELTSMQFHKVTLHFSPSLLIVDRCHLRACQITDEFLRMLSKNRVLSSCSFPDAGPVDGGSFCVTDDELVAFCAQQDVQVDPEREQLEEELTLYHGSFTKDLFKRLIEASSVSMRTRPLQITVSPVRFEEEGLRDYAQHLTYRRRGQLWQQRIYDFPCEQHGAATGMRLQIVLERETLILIRNRHDSIGFY